MMDLGVRSPPLSQQLKVLSQKPIRRANESLPIARREQGPCSRPGNRLRHPTTIRREDGSAAGKRLERGKSEGFDRAGCNVEIDRREQIGGLLILDTAFVDDLMGCLLELLSGMPRSTDVALRERCVDIVRQP